MKENNEAEKEGASVGVVLKRIVMPEYGAFVKASKKLVRRRERPNRKVWKEEKADINGIFLGIRTLYNGKVISNYDEGTYFERQDHFKCAVVSPGPHNNPVYVPLLSLGA